MRYLLLFLYAFSAFEARSMHQDDSGNRKFSPPLHWHLRAAFGGCGVFLNAADDHDLNMRSSLIELSYNLFQEIKRDVGLLKPEQVEELNYIVFCYNYMLDKKWDYLEVGVRRQGNHKPIPFWLRSVLTLDGFSHVVRIMVAGRLLQGEQSKAEGQLRSDLSKKPGFDRLYMKSVAQMNQKDIIEYFVDQKCDWPDSIKNVSGSLKVNPALTPMQALYNATCRQDSSAETSGSNVGHVFSSTTRHSGAPTVVPSDEFGHGAQVSAVTPPIPTRLHIGHSGAPTVGPSDKFGHGAQVSAVGSLRPITSPEIVGLARSIEPIETVFLTFATIKGQILHLAGSIGSTEEFSRAFERHGLSILANTSDEKNTRRAKLAFVTIMLYARSVLDSSIKLLPDKGVSSTITGYNELIEISSIKLEVISSIKLEVSDHTLGREYIWLSQMLATDTKGHYANLNSLICRLLNNIRNDCLRVCLPLDLLLHDDEGISYAPHYQSLREALDHFGLSYSIPKAAPAAALSGGDHGITADRILEMAKFTTNWLGVEDFLRKNGLETLAGTLNSSRAGECCYRRIHAVFAAIMLRAGDIISGDEPPVYEQPLYEQARAVTFSYNCFIGIFGLRLETKPIPIVTRQGGAPQPDKSKAKLFNQLHILFCLNPRGEGRYDMLNKVIDFAAYTYSGEVRGKHAQWDELKPVYEFYNLFFPACREAFESIPKDSLLEKHVETT